jgi:hypothetical protein
MRLFAPVVLLLLLLNGCAKNTKSCNALQAGIFYNDLNLVKKEINELCADLYPLPTPNDPDGHRENLNKLVERIKKCSNEAGIYCYACIHTLPAQSEIYITVFRNSTSVKKTIDISTSKNAPLRFSSMHD